MSRPPPLEISEAIIDHLHDEQPTLSACSIVCKSWMPRSRSHIFYDVKLQFEHARKVGNFLAVLISPTRPGRYVRQLRIEGFGLSRGIAAALPILTENIPNLEQLALRLIRWDVMADRGELRAQPFSGFETVRKLGIRNNYFADASQALGLVSSFPALDYLFCYDVWYRGSDTISPERIVSYPNPHLLRKVRLECSRVDGIMQWIIASQKHLSSLELSMISNDGMQYVGNLLRTLGPSLEDLQMGIFLVEEHGDHPCTLFASVLTSLKDTWEQYIDLAHNTRLRSLHIIDPFYTSNAEIVSLGWIPLMLSQIRSPQVTHICFSLQANLAQLESVNWDQVRLILEEPRFSCLRHLVFTGLDDDAVGMVTEKLSTLAGRGLLKFNLTPK